MIVDKMKNQPAPEEAKGGRKLSKEQEADARLATATGLMLMDEPKFQEGMGQALSSADPVMALGQIVGQTVLKLRDKFEQSGVNISPDVWLAKGGVADRIIDQAIMNLDSQGDDSLRGADMEVYDEVINVIKLAAQAGKGGGQQPAPGPEMGGMV